MPTRSFPRVEVEWTDAASTPGWNVLRDVLDDRGTVEVHTIGYLIRRTPKLIQLAQSYHASGDDVRLGEPFSIPRGCVRKVTRIKA